MYLSELLDLLETLKDSLPDTEDPRVEIHQQETWPLKSQITNVRILSNTIVIAAGPATEYGNRKAWTDEEEDEEDNA